MKTLEWWILGGIVLLAIYRPVETSMGPLVTPTGGANGNADLDTPYSVLPDGTNVTAEEFQAISGLCRDAPLNSFGEQCLGITWDFGADGAKRDFRTAAGTVALDFQVAPAMGM